MIHVSFKKKHTQKKQASEFFKRRFWDQKRLLHNLSNENVTFSTLDTFDDCAGIKFNAKPNHLHVPCVIRNKCLGVYSVCVFIALL